MRYRRPTMIRVADVQKRLGIVGRAEELGSLLACAEAGRHVLLEGPVGVGKTALARAVASALGRPIVRVDGDGRYTEQKLTGWFDPPAVMRGGYSADAFLAGPLVEAMRGGGVLFVNELNRMPEGVQNVLLPVLDEGEVQVPKLGAVKAAPGFWTIATQNPREFVATSHLSEALLDRFELVVLRHPPAADETEICRREVLSALGTASAPVDSIVASAVALVRATRNDARLRRGASVRAAISVALLALRFADSGESASAALARAALLALPTRVEPADDATLPLDEILTELAAAAATVSKKKA